MGYIRLSAALEGVGLLVDESLVEIEVEMEVEIEVEIETDVEIEIGDGG